MNQVTEIVLTFVVGIIGIAVLALLISPKARTSEVIQSLASGMANNIAVAQSPVTGNKVDIVTAYPNSGGFSALNGPANLF